MSDWPPIVFHFGTENWEEQLKKPPCIYSSQMILFLKKVDLNWAVLIFGEVWKDGENADR